jgi:Antitoxin VbhA
MNVITPKKPEAKISAEEMERRRERIRRGDAHNRIEGLVRGPETDSVFDAYIHGEIEVTDIVPRLKALHIRS